ncbi:leucine-rich repeats and immunoglobulin-like domains protein 3 [Orussus abietinus]|uniref:leucine-rich repeats and immunoglobulin-like domains protein 3 n=1 Tax=Orussus abietinus TaxID=222816 RepID=UPI000624F889|nr:leucine-rich repeats and immunoglobulin-like domains protein 3 [Orussus abietinus]
MSDSRYATLAHFLRWKKGSAVNRFLAIWLILILNCATRIAARTTAAGNQCPVECKCLGVLVDCSGLRLVGTPNGLPPWTVTLDLTANNLSNNIALSDLPQLKWLKLNENQLSRIPELPFLESVNHLSLTQNSISEINGSALRRLPDLRNLDLSVNKLTALRRGSFLSSNRLTHLNLNMNQISSIENGSLDNLTELEELRLNKNRLTQLKDLFTNLGNLRVLELNKNNLHQIQGLSLKNLKSLLELRLKRNKIERLNDGAFWPLKNLLVLELDYNLLSEVKKGGLFGLDHLQKLTMSHNRISTIETQAWDMCKEIIELDLSNNAISSIERGSFEFLGRLEILRMDYNEITHISDGAFNNTPNLQILELNSNKISYMVEDTSGAFGPLGQLLKLGLADNRIKSINKNAFTGLTRVKELDLTGNNITSIQENAFVSVPSLTKLKMNTGALVCDCGLQWLSVWLRTHDYEDAEVSCGYPHWLQGMQLTQLHHENFTCDEFPKPRIIEEPVSRLGIMGRNVTMTCRASSTSDSPLRFTWKRDNVELKNGNFQTDSDSSNGTVNEAISILCLTNLTRNDTGKYQCMVSNAYGTTYSSKAKLTVLVFPEFINEPKDIRVTAGSMATLQCKAKGEPSPQIAWQKDGGNDFPAARERRMHMMPTDDVFFIMGVKPADSGMYSCTAQNLAGVKVANATLTVLETPSFVKPMENKEIMAGSSIVLECMASGSPRPKLSWRKNGSPLQATERHFFTAEDQLLIIVDTVASDAGSYECEMNNSLGSVVGASHLTIYPASSSMINEDDMLGLLIITVVCCAVGTSIVWVVIIYQTRRRLNAVQNATRHPPTTFVPNGPDAQTQLYLDTSSQHSKDSGTGDSTNPSSDQLQLCLPEEIVACAINNEEESAATNGDDPLLRYTNHERHIRVQPGSVA